MASRIAPAGSSMRDWPGTPSEPASPAPSNPGRHTSAPCCAPRTAPARPKAPGHTSPRNRGPKADRSQNRSPGRLSPALSPPSTITGTIVRGRGGQSQTSSDVHSRSRFLPPLARRLHYIIPSSEFPSRTHSKSHQWRGPMNAFRNQKIRRKVCPSLELLDMRIAPAAMGTAATLAAEIKVEVSHVHRWDVALATAQQGSAKADLLTGIISRTEAANRHAGTSPRSH